MQTDLSRNYIGKQACKKIAWLKTVFTPMDRFSIGHEFPVHFFKERESDNRSVLFIGTHTQLWLVVVLKFSPIRAQEMGIHVLLNLSVGI